MWIALVPMPAAAGASGTVCECDSGPVCMGAVVNGRLSSPDLSRMEWKPDVP